MTYTVKQIMERYGVSQATVLHWIHTGQLTVLALGRDPGKKRGRFKATDQQILDFESSRTTAPPPAPRTRRDGYATDTL
jgi:transposase